MEKAKWGTKRQCPKCGTRFYDLGKEDPVVCIECENEWVPEPILKSRQPLVEEAKKKDDVKIKPEVDDEDEELIVDDELEIDEDDDSDLGDDDLDLDDGSDVPDVITKATSDDE